MALLEVHDIHTYYGNIHALRGVSIEVEEGEIVTLIGGNGAGKTTTLNTISGVTPARHGTVVLDGQDITTVPPHEIVGLGVTQSPEGRRIFARLSVQENLDLGAYSRRDRDGIKHTVEKVYELFPRLAERRNQPGGTLSGGEQQMLALGRARMSNPALLMIDEPSLGLAPVLAEDVFKELKRLNANTGQTILLIEQNARAALSIADYAYILETGTIVLQGPAAELAQMDEVRQSYLGVH